MTSESEKLAPCPFCGAPGNVEQYEEGWIVGCSRKAVGLTLACPLFPSFAWTNEKAEAIAAWNRRSPEGYDVAPLEWERVNDYRHYAKCVIGYYDVRDSLVSPGQWFFELNDRSADPLLFPTLDEAKAAAEADYRQRILSALRPRQGTAPAVGGEELTQPPLVFGYTNWRGEYAVRKVIPLKVWYGGTEWHPEPQWLLKALDAEKGNAERDFAIQDMSWSTPRRPHSRCAVSSPPSVPQKGAEPGWQLVPVEPTREMLREGAARVRDFLRKGGEYPRTHSMYSAILAAAPSKSSVTE